MSDYYYERPGRIIDPEEMAGRTIASVGFQFDSMAIQFTDGTFFFVFADHDGDHHDVSADLECEAEITYEQAMSADLITREEYRAAIERRRANEKATREAEQRQLYESLKAKFEPTTSGDPACPTS